MENIEHVAVTAHFLAGDLIELTAVDVIPPDDFEDYTIEFYRVRAVLAVARLLKRGAPRMKVTWTDNSSVA